FKNTVKNRRAGALPLTKNTQLGVKVDGIGREPSSVLAKMKYRRARALPLKPQETQGENASQRCLAVPCTACPVRHALYGMPCTAMGMMASTFDLPLLRSSHLPGG
ncbi:hypothetical protein NZK35_30895, partial [Stieleria sp. ICT_E10.1]|uniref:hypothetical protein n=1 Tax=Stieleria sedimenti TaxID=2976331 RepID=UPI0021807061